MTKTLSSVGEMFAESGAAKPVVKGKVGEPVNLPEANLKTLFTTATGAVPDTQREMAVVGSATRSPRLLDQVLQVPTSQDVVTYAEETTYTNNAAETAEGGTYGEAALAFTDRSSNVRKITVWLPATDEVLEDVDGLPAYVDQRLGFMARQRLELQMLVGNGTAPNLRGVLNVAGIQTQAKGADTAAVALRKAITKVRTPGFAEPSLTVLNPTNAEGLDLAAAVDLLAPYVVENSLWTVPRTENAALTAGTAIVGDFLNFCALRIRRGLTMQVTNSHSTFFVEGKQAIRVDFRVAFPVYRPAAFCLVTGL